MDTTTFGDPQVYKSLPVICKWLGEQNRREQKRMVRFFSMFGGIIHSVTNIPNVAHQVRLLLMLKEEYIYNVDRLCKEHNYPEFIRTHIRHFIVTKFTRLLQERQA